MITASVRKEIEKEAHDNIVSIAPLSTANNAQIYRLTLGTGKLLVAKVAEYGMDTEAWMLNYLRENSKLPIPKVYYSNEHIIAMQHVAGQQVTDEQAQRNAGEHLAALHQIRADEYGFERDTLIGSMPQPNPKTGDWAAFFTEHRLLYMAREAQREGKVDGGFIRQVEKLVPKISAMIKNAQPPSLLHGDVWSGNVLASRGKIEAFLDPAIYYGDPEIELAFIRLFNTFGGSFFARYGEINPIRPGFYEERADIYALYPLLVHTRLFGASYARKAKKILDRFS